MLCWEIISERRIINKEGNTEVYQIMGSGVHAPIFYGSEIGLIQLILNGVSSNIFLYSLGNFFLEPLLRIFNDLAMISAPF